MGFVLSDFFKSDIGVLQDHMSKVSPPIPERSGTYGVGMYGIGAR